MMLRKKIIAAFICTMLAGCGATSLSNMMGSTPEMNTKTETTDILRSLPSAMVKPVVAVYDFNDQTGQYKPNDKVAEFSKAVTQGGTTILNEALVKAGSGGWFTVIERSGLEHLLRERQIIAATREQYGAGRAKLPPMLYAGVLLEGGIVSYETNTLTGGLGAKFLGVGGNAEYRQDIVTVYLRAVNVQNGEVLISVNTAKTIYSTAISGGAYRFTALNELLELESGITMNEPPQVATRQAIEASVYSMIMEGALKGIWEFADATAGRLETQRYLARLNNESLPELEDIQPVAVDNYNPQDTAAEVAAPVVDVVEEPTPVVVKEELRQMPAEAVSQKPVRMERILREETKKPRGLLNDSRYSDRVGDPKTQMYCTTGGCYPVP